MLDSTDFLAYSRAVRNHRIRPDALLYLASVPAKAGQRTPNRTLVIGESATKSRICQPHCDPNSRPSTSIPRAVHEHRHMAPLRGLVLDDRRRHRRRQVPQHFVQGSPRPASSGAAGTPRPSSSRWTSSPRSASTSDSEPLPAASDATRLHCVSASDAPRTRLFTETASARRGSRPRRFASAARNAAPPVPVRRSSVNPISTLPGTGNYGLHAMHLRGELVRAGHSTGQVPRSVRRFNHLRRPRRRSIVRLSGAQGHCQGGTLAEYQVFPDWNALPSMLATGGTTKPSP